MGEDEGSARRSKSLTDEFASEGAAMTSNYTGGESNENLARKFGSNSLSDPKAVLLEISSQLDNISTGVRQELRFLQDGKTNLKQTVLDMQSLLRGKREPLFSHCVGCSEIIQEPRQRKKILCGTTLRWKRTCCTRQGGVKASCCAYEEPTECCPSSKHKAAGRRKESHKCHCGDEFDILTSSERCPCHASKYGISAQLNRHLVLKDSSDYLLDIPRTTYEDETDMRKTCIVCTCGNCATKIAERGIFEKKTKRKLSGSGSIFPLCGSCEGTGNTRGGISLTSTDTSTAYRPTRTESQQALIDLLRRSRRGSVRSRKSISEYKIPPCASEMTSAAKDICSTTCSGSHNRSSSQPPCPDFAAIRKGKSYRQPDPFLSEIRFTPASQQDPPCCDDPTRHTTTCPKSKCSNRTYKMFKNVGPAGIDEPCSKRPTCRDVSALPDSGPRDCKRKECRTKTSQSDKPPSCTSQVICEAVPTVDYAHGTGLQLGGKGKPKGPATTVMPVTVQKKDNYIDFQAPGCSRDSSRNFSSKSKTQTKVTPSKGQLSSHRSTCQKPPSSPVTGRKVCTKSTSKEKSSLINTRRLNK